LKFGSIHRIERDADSKLRAVLTNFGGCSMKSGDDELPRAEGFIQSNWPAMLRIARAELEDKNCAAPDAHAEDVAGSTRITLLEDWETLTSPKGAMYVYTARRARTHARKCRREFPDEANENSIPFFSKPGLNPEEILEQAEVIAWALSHLNENEKEVIVKRFLEDLSFASIATMLGMPPGTVTSIYSRALAKMRTASAAQQAVSSAALREEKLNSLKRRPS
jgi:RNA polymerase sigma factor (sigma-70 family)